MVFVMTLTNILMIRTYCFFVEPEPVSNVILAMDRVILLGESTTSINVLLPRFNEDGKIG